MLDKKVPAKTLDYFVAPINAGFWKEAVKLTAKLRKRGFKSIFAYEAAGFPGRETASLSKQLKRASSQNAKYCIIIGDEFKNNQVAVKDMAAGKQETVDLDKFLAELGG